MEYKHSVSEVELATFPDLHTIQFLIASREIEIRSLRPFLVVSVSSIAVSNIHKHTAPCSIEEHMHEMCYLIGDLSPHLST